MLFTVSCDGLDVYGFENILSKNGLTHLVDMRSVFVRSKSGSSSGDTKGQVERDVARHDGWSLAGACDVLKVAEEMMETKFVSVGWELQDAVLVEVVELSRSDLQERLRHRCDAAITNGHIDVVAFQSRSMRDGPLSDINVFRLRYGCTLVCSALRRLDVDKRSVELANHSLFLGIGVDLSCVWHFKSGKESARRAWAYVRQ